MSEIIRMAFIIFSIFPWKYEKNQISPCLWLNTIDEYLNDIIVPTIGDFTKYFLYEVFDNFASEMRI